MALAAGAGALLGAVATCWFGFVSKDEELRVPFVEIALSTLRALVARWSTVARGAPSASGAQRPVIVFRCVSRCRQLETTAQAKSWRQIATAGEEKKGGSFSELPLPSSGPFRGIPSGG